MTNTLSRVESWANFLSGKEIPVLQQTVRALAEARQRSDGLSVRQLATIILRDPLMSARLLRFVTRHRASRKLQEISTVEHAVMMLGVEPFFHHFSHFDVMEDLLKPYPQAMLGLLQVVRRAQRASRYAWDWAGWRADLNGEEVAVAALLHDLAEMLIWCFMPQQALKIQQQQKADPAMHGMDAQKNALGFTLNSLQAALCHKWQLPELLLNLMDDTHADRPRVRNVKLAVDLARHSAQGWDYPALPQDLHEIAVWMRVDADTVMARLGLKGIVAGSPSEPPGIGS